MDEPEAPSAGRELAEHGAADAPSDPGFDVDPNAVYALGSSRGETARLQRQADELGPESSALLDRVGLRRGDSAIDLGCGPRGVLELLSERVSPGGRVVGLDADAAHVAMASRYLADRGLNDVEVLCADARNTGLDAGSFDLVHARALLVNVPEPAEVLAEMGRLARPGGWVVGLEPDAQVAICHPSHPAFDRLCELLLVAFSRNGADPHTGRRLGELYRQAGLQEVTVDIRAAAYPAGHSRRTIRADLIRTLRPQIIAMGLANEHELDQLDQAAHGHFANPDTLVMPFLNFLACGR
ncbi:MAG: methyltransferase domain-containing protein, partial [Solirubrobacterales bacterium]|nr:methyltransferase domain-containing protein [Solirubrobacterales bacterium]